MTTRQLAEWLSNIGGGTAEPAGAGQFAAAVAIVGSVLLGRPMRGEAA